MELPKMQQICNAIENAVKTSVQAIQLHGIADAELRSAALSSQQVRQVADQLNRQGKCELKLTAEVELFLRISNTDVLSSIERAVFLVNITSHGNNLCAVANYREDWEMAWRRGIEPLKETALQGIRQDIWNIDETLAEGSYTFRSAMVLLASELIGPYVDRIATFVGYPRAVVQVIGVRLQDAMIWEGDEVRCESWFDPKKGAAAFLLDLMVAEGQLVRRWSEAKKQYAYHLPDIKSVSQYSV